MNKTVQLFNVALNKWHYKNLKEVFLSSQISKGYEIVKFEKNFSKFINNQNFKTTSDVSSSILLSLLTIGIKPGDEILSNPLACISTNVPIVNMFAKPIWYDTKPFSSSPDIQSLKKNFSKKTKAIIVYHWGGNPVELNEIYTFARKKNIPVIEDAGEAFGSTYSGKFLGNTGSDFSCFSFHAIRHITSIEGGGISCKLKRNIDLIDKIRRFGIDQKTFRDSLGEINSKSDVPVAGYNLYMNNLSANIANSQMSKISEKIKISSSNGIYYDKNLKNIDNLKLYNYSNNSSSSFWVYTIFVHRPRDLILRLKKKGVQASQLHFRNDRYSVFKSNRNKKKLKNIDVFSKTSVSIPCGWWVNKKQIDYIIWAIKKGW